MWWKKLDKKLSPIEKELIYFGLLFAGVVTAYWFIQNAAKVVRFFKKPEK